MKDTADQWAAIKFNGFSLDKEERASVEREFDSRLSDAISSRLSTTKNPNAKYKLLLMCQGAKYAGRDELKTGDYYGFIALKVKVHLIDSQDRAITTVAETGNVMGVMRKIDTVTGSDIFEHISLLADSLTNLIIEVIQTGRPISELTRPLSK